MIMDDFSRYTWAIPIQEKSDDFDAAQHLFKKIQVEQNCQIMRIRSDHGREFENSKFKEFCLSYGIKPKFSSPISPQQNGVVERKNRVIQEMARVMIHSKNLAQHLWGEAVNTACHVINKVYLRRKTIKTPYEIWRGKKPTVKYFRTFGSNAISFVTGRILESLIPRAMKEYSWGIPETVELTRSSIKEQRLLWNL